MNKTCCWEIAFITWNGFLLVFSQPPFISKTGLTQLQFVSEDTKWSRMKCQTISGALNPPEDFPRWKGSFWKIKKLFCVESPSCMKHSDFVGSQWYRVWNLLVSPKIPQQTIALFQVGKTQSQTFWNLCHSTMYFKTRISIRGWLCIDERKISSHDLFTIWAYLARRDIVCHFVKKGTNWWEINTASKYLLTRDLGRPISLSEGHKTSSDPI